ncbi:Formate dehydrogenase iron-sulfur subunit [Sulfurospirillum diekertiae]|uniref:Formate dehydrogenase iron-sulfur subunit n=1 Tax=Sulfurospirillum diekertiae TaxID=1854492 RepID=A0A1Y0HNV8_9BACT|nr:Formate dehydrogenase iron-sulfur subunit [Sulfurospirillum diekertiae]
MEYARMKFYCDESRCIECDGCSVACAEAHELPVGISRRKVVTINEGIPGKELIIGPKVFPHSAKKYYAFNLYNRIIHQVAAISFW